MIAFLVPALMLSAQSADPFGIEKVSPVAFLEKAEVKRADYVVIGRDKPDGYMGPLGLAAITRQTGAKVKPSIPVVRHSGKDREGLWKSPVEIYTFTPSQKGVKWACSIHFKPAAAEEHRVYLVEDLTAPSADNIIKLQNFQLKELTKLSGASLKPGIPVEIPNVVIKPETRPFTLLIAPESAGVWSSDADPSQLTSLEADTPIGRIAKLSLGVGPNKKEKPFWEPSVFHGATRPDIHAFPKKDGEITLILAGGESAFRVQRFREGKQADSFDLPLSHGVLSNVIEAPNGDFYYFTHANGENPKASVVRANSKGELVAKYDLGFAEREFDFRSLEDTTSSLAYAEQGLCLVTSRTLQNGHQSSFAAVFNPSSLELIKNHGQNCSHSFANRAILDGGYFITADLGDNYPRGIVLHKLARQDKKGKVVYTYKTRHGDVDEPHRNGPDGRPLQAYKWSNDNATYTELGDIAATNRGYLVVFSSEKSTENNLAVSHHNEARNLGLVLVRRNFEQVAQKDIVVPEQLILTKGDASPLFGFYDFGGGYTPQQNRGVVWLTNFKDRSENVVHPRVAKISSDRYLIIWEKWSETKFLGSQAVVINEMGEPQIEPINLGATVRVPNGAVLHVVGSHILWVERQGSRANVFAWKLKSF